MNQDRDGGDRIDITKIEFEWYPPKAQANLKKHKVSFEEAKTVFGGQEDR